MSTEAIEKVLETYVRPKLSEHEGDVEIVAYENHILKVRMLGKCSGCPSATLTTEELIATEVKEHIPEVEDVVLVNEVSQELLDMAKQIMMSRRKAGEGRRRQITDRCWNEVQVDSDCCRSAICVSGR